MLSDFRKMIAVVVVVVAAAGAVTAAVAAAVAIAANLEVCVIEVDDRSRKE